MTMRMSGMMSGLDTESIIQQLVAAKQVKVDTQKKAQTKLSWQQEAWAELNTKLKNLQTKFISNMRFSSSYTKKTTKVSDSTKVSVITGENAVNGVQSLKISQLAKSGYLTGGVVEKKTGGDEITALSKLSDIAGGAIADNADGTAGTGTFTVKTASGSVDIKVTNDTTISDILNQIKSVGLNATFDAKWGRFNISSPNSGKDNDFSITASDANGAQALAALGLQTDLTSDEASRKEYESYAKYVGANDNATLANMQSLIDADVEARKNSYLEQYKSLMDAKKAAKDTIDSINQRYSGALDTVDNYKTALEAKERDLETAKNSGTASEEDIANLQAEAEELRVKMADAQVLADQNANIANYDTQLADIAQYATVVDDGNGNYTVTDTGKIQAEVEQRYLDKANYAASVIAKGAVVDADGNIISISDSTKGASKVSGQDAEIELNGAKYTNSNNTFEINGLTFTALSETKDDETVTVTTEQDTDGIYDMIKNFLKEYNELVNEMDKLYSADAAKGYEPLTDEEKESMSESEIEKWETKIKESLLRRDDNLSSINSALQTIMAGGIEVNGKTMYLFDFGIETLGYFASADNEKHAYHIDGDPDDDYTSGNSDKLKSMIANDPDTVISFFSKLSANLYDKMFDMSKSVDGYRSFGNFYDDKKMKSDYDDYTTKIAELEAKLADYEDKWYSKFSKMETALAKLQSNMSAVTSLLGG